MPSLQLLQLTAHGRSLLASRRKTLAAATGILVAGGTAAYVQWRWQSRVVRPNYSNHDTTTVNNKENLRTRKKKGGLRSLQVLAAILLTHMGRKGVQNLLALVAIVVSFLAYIILRI